MAQVADPSRYLTLHAIQEARKRSPGDSRLLRLAHLGCGHHLHRFGNTGCIVHGPNAVAEVVRAMHGRYSQTEMRGSLPRFLETVDRSFQFLTYGVAEHSFVRDF